MKVYYLRPLDKVVLHTEETLEWAKIARKSPFTVVELKTISMSALKPRLHNPVAFILTTRGGSHLSGRHQKGHPYLSKSEPPRSYRSYSGAVKGARMHSARIDGDSGDNHGLTVKALIEVPSVAMPGV